MLNKIFGREIRKGKSLRLGALKMEVLDYSNKTDLTKAYRNSTHTTQTNRLAISKREGH